MDTKQLKRIAEIVKACKQKNLTEEGKARKQRVVEKLFYKRDNTLLYIHTYLSVLPLLKSFILTFEQKAPMAHRIHDEQLTLLTTFLSCFIKQEHLKAILPKDLSRLDVESKNIHQPLDEIFLGAKARKLLKKKRLVPNIMMTKFLPTLQGAYIETAKYLLKKLPINNPLLRRLGAIDPVAILARHSAAASLLKKLGKENFPEIIHGTEDEYDKEVLRITCDPTLPPASVDGVAIRLDHWWAGILKSYPVLGKVIQACLSVITSPIVEQNFSVMNNVIDAKSNRMDIKTFSSIQTIKYNLRAQATTSLKLFHRDDILYSPVDRPLSYHMQTASARKKKEEKQRTEAKKAKQTSKKSAKKAAADRPSTCSSIHSKAKQLRKSMLGKRKAVNVDSSSTDQKTKKLRTERSDNRRAKQIRKRAIQTMQHKKKKKKFLEQSQ